MQKILLYSEEEVAKLREEWKGGFSIRVFLKNGYLGDYKI